MAVEEKKTRRVRKKIWKNDPVTITFANKDSICIDTDNDIFITDPKEIEAFLSPRELGNLEMVGSDANPNDYLSQPYPNLLLKGNNLIALHSLKHRFANQVKLIYIDPPYNTGNDSFNYNDRFNHSTWLTFMKNRLEIARELLRDDGVIFVQCDDNEQAYLKVLMDEIFGKDNFVNCFMWLHGKGKKDKNSRTLQEYILSYGKNKENLENWIDFRKISGKKSNPDNDSRGDWFSGSISFSEDRSNKKHQNYFTIKSPSGIDWTRQWQCSYEEMQEHLRCNKIFFGLPPQYNSVPRLKIFDNELIKVIPNNIIDDVGTTKSASNELQALFANASDRSVVGGEGESLREGEGSDFAIQAPSPSLKKEKTARDSDTEEDFAEKLKKHTPKPEALLKRIIEISTKEGDLVLDFFAGSGTTLAVAHKMGRRWIGIEQMDYVESITKERLKKVIEGEQGGMSKTLQWNGGGEFVYAEIIDSTPNTATLQALQDCKTEQDGDKTYQNFEDYLKDLENDK